MGLLTGALICLANTYYGLQTGVDAVVNLIWHGFHPVWTLLHSRAFDDHVSGFDRSSLDHTTRADSFEVSSHAPDSNEDSLMFDSPSSRPTPHINVTGAAYVALSTSVLLGTASLVAAIVCIVTVHVLFQCSFR